MMDTQDHRKTGPSGHENHGVHLCHKCGWPFPNPHPSAKHRRAHKRICGSIEGYKLIDSGEHDNTTVSDDEHGSGEDQRTPSPKIEKKSTIEISSGGVVDTSNRSEYEVFSDAVTEFSDSGFSPGNEERFEGARVSDTNVEKVVEGDQSNQELKVDGTADIVQLPSTQTDSSQTHNSKVLETATNLFGSATPSEDVVLSSNSDSVVSSNSIEELAVCLSSVNGSAVDLSPFKSETLTDSPKEHVNTEIGDHGLQHSMTLVERETDVKGNEESNVDEVLSDVAVTPSKTASKASGQIVESKEEENHELGPKMSLLNISPEVKSFECMEVLVNAAQIESDSAQEMDVGSHGDSVEGCYTKEEGNVNVHVLSVANDIPVIDHVDIVIKDFKDHKAVESNLPVTLHSGEVTERVVDNNRETVYEKNSSSFHSTKSGESIFISSADLHALEDNLNQKGGYRVLVAEEPVEGETDTSELKVRSEDLGSNAVVPPETSKSGIQEIQTDSHLEGQQPHNFSNDSSQKHLPEPATMGLSDVIPMAISPDDKVSHTTILSGGDNADDQEKDRTEKCDINGKDRGEVVEEEPLTNIKTTSESADNLFVSIANQITNSLGTGNSGDHGTTGFEISDPAGSESRDVALGEMTLESACRLSEPEVAVDDGMDKVMKQETESTTYFVSDSSEVGPDSSHLVIMAPTHCDSQNCQDEDSQEAIKEPNFSSKKEVLAENVSAACKGAKSNHDGDAEVLKKISEIPPECLPTMKSSAIGEDSHCRDDGLGASGISTEHLQEEGGEKLTKQLNEVSAVDSSNQTDSLGGNWVSVSGAVLSTQSDALAATAAEVSASTASQALAQSERINLQKPQTTSEGHHSNKSDVFEPPSFMTLVELRNGVDQKAASFDVQTTQNTQQPKSEALQAGWFPSLTNVVNESQGRKKNEEIIAKVTNWSTGKQHTALKSLLGEDNSPKQTPTAIKEDENTTINNDASATTVNSLLGPEAPTDQVGKREIGTEWSSPARYPTDKKKEKRKVKGRPYWVPFVCCSTAN